MVINLLDEYYKRIDKCQVYIRLKAKNIKLDLPIRNADLFCTVFIIDKP